MKNSTIERQIIEGVKKLSKDKQKRILDIIHHSQIRQKGQKGNDLIHFAGLIGRKDLERIEEAINEGCENINLNEW